MSAQRRQELRRSIPCCRGAPTPTLATLLAIGGRIFPYWRGSSMKRVISVPATAVVILLSAQALAVDSMSQSKIDRRHTAQCMTKRMMSDRTLSYNAAAKVCKDELKAQNGLVAAGTPLQAVNR
jgi:hypothetical protein